MDLAGRILIAFLFAAGAVQKWLDPVPVTNLLAQAGLPAWLLWPAALFNAGGAVALVAGIAMRHMALALAAYCMATSVFHLMQNDPWQTTIFVKNWAIAGGLLVLAASRRA